MNDAIQMILTTAVLCFSGGFALILGGWAGMQLGVHLWGGIKVASTKTENHYHHHSTPMSDPPVPTL